MPQAIGALEGIASGMQAGLDSYDKERAYQDSLKEQAFQNKIAKAKMQAAGFDPDTGLPTAEAKANERMDYFFKAKQAGLQMQDGQTNYRDPTAYQEDPIHKQERLQQQAQQQIQLDPTTGQPVFNSAIAAERKSENNQQLQSRLQEMSAQGTQEQRNEAFKSKLMPATAQANLNYERGKDAVAQGQGEYQPNGTVKFGQPSMLGPKQVELLAKQQKAAFGSLPEESQIQLKDFGKEKGNLKEALGSLDSVINQLNDPNISDDDARQAVKDMARRIANTEGKDSFRKEEANRILGATQYQKFNTRFSSNYDPRLPTNGFADRNVMLNQLKMSAQRIQDRQQQVDAQTEDLLAPVKSLMPNLNRYSPGGSAPHPQDDVAIKWAKDHPGDKRSIAILQANGIK